MSQQQAVQPIVLKQDNGEVVLKLVLENPKSETQTLILQQPNGEEFAMSTDRTAIAAFDYATGIAVFLALCATGLAYWYGARSFDLTTKAFNLTLKQIGDETQKTLTSNKELYQSQENLKIKELDYAFRKELAFKLINDIAQFKYKFSKYVIMIAARYDREITYEDWETEDSYKEQREIFDKLSKDLDYLIINIKTNLMMCVDDFKFLLSDWNELEEMIIKYRMVGITALANTEISMDVSYIVETKFDEFLLQVKDNLKLKNSS